MNTNQTEQKLAVPKNQLEPEPFLDDFHVVVEFFDLLIKVDQRINGNKYRDACSETKTLANQTPDVLEVI